MTCTRHEPAWRPPKRSAGATTRRTGSGFAAVEARILRAEGLNAEALAIAESVLPAREELSITDTNVKLSVVEAIALRPRPPYLDKAGRLLAIPELLDPGELTPFLQASTAQLRARLDAARGDHEHVDGRFRTAVTLFREFGLVFCLAVAQLGSRARLAPRARPACRCATPARGGAQGARRAARDPLDRARPACREAELREVSVGR